MASANSSTKSSRIFMIGLFVVIIVVIVIWIRHNRNTTTGYDAKGSRVIVKPDGAEKKNNTPGK